MDFDEKVVFLVRWGLRLAVAAIVLKILGFFAIGILFGVFFGGGKIRESETVLDLAPGVSVVVEENVSMAPQGDIGYSQRFRVEDRVILRSTFKNVNSPIKTGISENCVFFYNKDVAGIFMNETWITFSLGQVPGFRIRTFAPTITYKGITGIYCQEGNVTIKFEIDHDSGRATTVDFGRNWSFE